MNRCGFASNDCTKTLQWVLLGSKFAIELNRCILKVGVGHGHIKNDVPLNMVMYYGLYDRAFTLVGLWLSLMTLYDRPY